LQKKIIDPEVLEVLVRDGHVSGELASELARIIEVNEDGVVKPLVELPAGIT
jgi:hypothetical protein